MLNFISTSKILVKYFGEEFFTCLSAVALVVSVALLTRNPITLDFVILILLSSIIVYFFDFFDDFSDFNFSRKNEISLIKHDNSLFKIITFLLVITSLSIIIIYGNLQTTIFLLVLYLLGILYPLFFKKLTTKIAGFKDIYVAAMWNLMVLLYFFYYSVPITTGLILLLLIIFTRDLVNASFCDVKDIEEDKVNGLLTFANIFGKKKLLTLLHATNLISVVLICSGVFLGLLSSDVLILIIPIIITSLLIFFSMLRKNYSTAAVDSEYFFWLIALLIAKWKVLWM